MVYRHARADGFSRGILLMLVVSYRYYWVLGGLIGLLPVWLGGNGTVSVCHRLLSVLTGYERCTALLGSYYCYHIAQTCSNEVGCRCKAVESGPRRGMTSCMV